MYNLSKTLYVGIGGTGADILLKIKKCFIDSYGEVPPMIGFMAIDTDTGSESKSERNNKGEIIKLNQSELNICTVRNAYGVYSQFPDSYSFIPSRNAHTLRNIQGLGAGQVRSNGKFIATYNTECISNCILKKINEINAVLPLNSNYSVIKGINNGTVNIFSSIAGGTGSGMLIDILNIIQKTLQSQNLICSVYPWLLLPDVFKNMNQGPSMKNVYYNAYGVIRELDYIMHLNTEVCIGNNNFNKGLFKYAYFFNNFNGNNDSITDLRDIEEVMAKSAFLPANEMGTDITTPFDNVFVAKDGGAFLIPQDGKKYNQKDGWVCGSGSAELLYDGYAVGYAYTYSIIASICRNMCNSTGDGSYEANSFVDNANVLIRENLGRDDVIDKLLTPAPSYSIQIDENTTVDDITEYLQLQYGTDADIIKSLPLKYKAILSNSKEQLDEKVKQIMQNDGAKGSVGNVLAFAKALRGIIALCNQEMTDEAKAFNDINKTDKQWDVLVNSIKKRGIAALFNSIDNDAVENLQNEIKNDVINHLEETRRVWASRFYVEFDEYVNSIIRKYSTLEQNMRSIENIRTNQLLSLQQNTSSESLFTINLHVNDVRNIPNNLLNESLITQFAQSFRNDLPLLEGMSMQTINTKLFDFVKDLSIVIDKVNTDVQEILSNLSAEERIKYINRLKQISAPLWGKDAQGFTAQQPNLSNLFIVGVYDRNNNIFQDETLAEIFNTSNAKATYSSTNRKDRISVLQIEGLLPAFAVKGFTTYDLENKTRITSSNDIVNYSDEELFKKMESERHSLLPSKKEEDSDCFKYWVFGFIFNYIKLDETKSKYQITSTQYGDPIENYIFNLGQDRTEAFKEFKNKNLASEIKEKIDAYIAENGLQNAKARIQKAQEPGEYKKLSQLTEAESQNLNNSNFKNVRDLLSREIDYVTRFLSIASV